MKRFTCSCGQVLFFENTHCLKCGRAVGFDSAALQLLSLRQAEKERFISSAGLSYRYCQNHVDHNNCNWLIRSADRQPYCVSCRLNRTIPNLSLQQNRIYWDQIERAKRRLIYSLLTLRLPVSRKTQSWPYGMAFDFIQDKASNPQVSDEQVITGHEGGLITLNIAEADDVYRAMTRKQMNESYRTLLGHFRHESGHYYFNYLLSQADQRKQFEKLFGDDQADYSTALQHYYHNGPVRNWQDVYISAYASAHPLEDWAECWAHFLHIYDSLETAQQHGIIKPCSVFKDFDAWIETWHHVSVIINELNRSMGTRDAYPFAIPSPVIEKLRFIYRLLARLQPAS